MREDPDHYAVLQVDARAESEVIEAAYRRLAVKYHPDRDPSPGATERMVLINAAYEVLSDLERRKAYDLHRGISRGRQATGPSQEDPWRSYSSWLLLALLAVVGLVVMAGVVRFVPRLLPLLGLLLLMGWAVWILRGSKG